LVAAGSHAPLPLAFRADYLADHTGKVGHRVDELIWSLSGPPKKLVRADQFAVSLMSIMSNGSPVKRRKLMNFPGRYMLAERNGC